MFRGLFDCFRGISGVVFLVVVVVRTENGDGKRGYKNTVSSNKFITNVIRIYFSRMHNMLGKLNKNLNTRFLIFVVGCGYLTRNNNQK